jgi:hypothetical protein
MPAPTGFVPGHPDGYATVCSVSFRGIVDLEAEVTDGRHQFDVSKQQLDSR